MFKDLKISMLIFMGMNWPNYKTKTFRKWACLIAPDMPAVIICKALPEKPVKA